MYECDGYGVNECAARVGESGLWSLRDGSMVVLCESCESEARNDGEKLGK